MTEKQTSQNLIQGKVASIINERELAINIGSENNVKTGMKFKVLADEQIEIFDPESNKSLGKVDREKVKVKAVEVHDLFSICRTYLVRYVGGSSFYNIVSASASLLAPPKKIVETLKADDSALIPSLSETESYVKKGDRVVQILDDDE